MKKKKLLLVFIFSFLCVIYTLNSICFKYIDNKIDTLAVQQIFHTSDVAQIKQIISDSRMIITSENVRLITSLTVGCLFFIIFTNLAEITALVCMILFLAVYFITYKLCIDNLLFISLSAPVFAIAVSKIFGQIYVRLFKENVDKKIETVLGKYISKDIKNKILKNTDNIGLGGKRAEITVMFADIRGFTSLSEKRKAEDVSSLLNEYFSELEPIITKYNGVINKFIGDAVLVIFGDPTEDKYHAQNAVKCAYEMRKKVKQIRERWITEGKPKIDIGIGINTGEAFIGNVGTSNRFEYTVIGDTVNIASRIEDYNKIYKTHILISENTYNKISQIVDVIKIREVSIKGKIKKINIYEVLRITE